MNDEIHNIIQTILLVNNPLTKNEDRIRGTQSVEMLKEGCPEKLTVIGFHLISLNDPFLSHIGWTFVEEVIRYKWNSLNVEFRLGLRNKVLSGLEEGPMQATIESISRCLVAMMEHEWPQNWPELTGQLVQLSTISSLHCSTVFSIFRRLSENAITLASVASIQRRRDMHSAINASLPQTLNLALDQLEYAPNREEHSLAIKYILGWLADVCEWAPPTILEPFVGRAVKSIVNFLTTAERNIYEIAARCLSSLANRKQEKSDHLIGVFFQSDVIAAILSTTSQAADVAESSESHYNYLKALCDLLTALGTNLAKVWTEQQPPPNFSVYLSAISAFFHHPSIFLKLEATEVMVILGQSILGKDPSFVNMLTNCAAHLPEALRKVGFPSESPPTPAGHYSQMDFDDDVDWSVAFMKFREKVRCLTKLMLKTHFAPLFDIFTNWVYQKTVTSAASISDVEWEAMQKYAKMVVQAGLDGKCVDQETMTKMLQMNLELLKFMAPMTDWDAVSEVLSIHSALVPTFAQWPEGLLQYVSILQSILERSSSHKIVNRHCISQILRIVVMFPEFFKNNAQVIVSLCQSVETKISPMQMAQLLQVLSALSNVVEREEDRIELLKMSVAPSLEYLLQNASAFETIEAFVSLNGFDQEPPVDCDDETREDVARRRALRRNMTALEGVLQQVNEKSPLGGVISNVYPVIFNLNRVIIEMNTQKAKQLTHPAYATICQISVAEKQQIYCSVGESMEAQTGKTAVESKEAADLSRQFLNCLADNCLTIISLCAQKFPESLFTHPQVAQLLGCTYLNMDALENFRLRYWFKKGWKSIILNCPKNHWHCLGQLMEGIASHMQRRLKTLWENIGNIDYDSEPTDEELFNEHMACVLSRDYIQLLRSIYMSSDNSTNAEEKTQSSITPMGEWLFEQRIAISPILLTCFEALTWRDTTCAIKIIPLCRFFTDKLFTNYDDEAAVGMLFSAIRSLQIHGSDEVAGSPLLGLVFHIYLTLRKFSNSFLSVLQQVPDATEDSIENFDRKVQAIISGEESMVEKQRREMTKKLLRGVISLTRGEQFRRPVYLRPLPAIEKRQKEQPDPDYVGVAAMFDC